MTIHSITEERFDSIRTDIWNIIQPSGGSVYADGQLHLRDDKSGNPAEIVSKLKISGDFDFQIDYNGNSYAHAQGAQGGYVRLVANSGERVHWYFVGTSSVPNYFIQPWDYIEENQNGNNIASVNKYGKFRFIREGSNTKLSYWTGSVWTQVKSYSNMGTEDITIHLGQASWGAYPEGTMVFDNLVFNSGKLGFTPVKASNIYDISSVKGNVRGEASSGYVRPTIRQFFTSENFQRIITPSDTFKDTSLNTERWDTFVTGTSSGSMDGNGGITLTADNPTTGGDTWCEYRLISQFGLINDFTAICDFTNVSVPLAETGEVRMWLYDSVSRDGLMFRYYRSYVSRMWLHRTASSWTSLTYDDVGTRTAFEFKIVKSGNSLNAYYNYGGSDIYLGGFTRSGSFEPLQLFISTVSSKTFPRAVAKLNSFTLEDQKYNGNYIVY